MKNLKLNFKDCKLLKFRPNIAKRNQSISSILEKSSAIFEMVYEIKNEKSIKIFGNYFICHNKGRCKMIINNKLYSLRVTYQINDNYKKILNIKLLILNESILNFRKTFYECKSLQKFSVISPKDIKLKSDEIHNEQKNNQIDVSSIFDSERINDQSSNILNYSNETEKNFQKISLIKNTNISSKGRNKFNIVKS